MDILCLLPFTRYTIEKILQSHIHLISVHTRNENILSYFLAKCFAIIYRGVA